MTFLWTHKKRRSSIPQEHKLALLQSLATVDGVVMGENLELGLDFQDHFLQLRPDILAVTEDDQYGELKRILCATTGAAYVVLPKTPPKFSPDLHNKNRTVDPRAAGSALAG